MPEDALIDELDPKEARRIINSYYGREVLTKVSDESIMKVLAKLFVTGWIVLGDDGNYRTRSGKIFKVASF